MERSPILGYGLCEGVKLLFKREPTWAKLALGLVGLLSLFVNTVNLDFPVGFHGDEAKKFRFVEENRQDYYHPILLLQAARLLNCLPWDDAQFSLAQICRAVSALSATGIVILCYVLTREFAPPVTGILASLSVAICPTIVVHAHYFKEDLIFSFFALWSVHRLILYWREKTSKNFFLLTLATGLSLSAQYKGLTLPFFYLLAERLCLDADQRMDGRAWRKLSLGTLSVFAICNLPAFWELRRAGGAFSAELRHAVTGHTLRVEPLSQFFTFHLRKSLLPGLTAPALVLALIGLVASLYFWKRTSTVQRVLVLFASTVYLCHEIILLKAYPDYSRYVVSTTPVLLILASQFAYQTHQKLSNPWSRLWVCLVLAGLFLYPAAITGQLLLNLDQRDTRRAAWAWLQTQGGSEQNCLFGRYTRLASPDPADQFYAKLQELDLPPTYRYIVVSSFEYERYAVGSELPLQRANVATRNGLFKELEARYSFVEFAPEFRSFAFSNPTIRIYDTSSLSSETSTRLTHPLTSRQTRSDLPLQE